MSRSTLIPTNPAHPTIMEFVITKTDLVVDYTLALHFRLSQAAGYNPMLDAPNYGELTDILWLRMSIVSIGFYASYQKLKELKVRQVISATRISPKRVDLIYGSSATTPGDLEPLFETTNPVGPYMPSYAQYYVKKFAPHSPRDILGSVRMGPIPESFSPPDDRNNLDPGTRNGLQAQWDDVLNPLTVTSAASGNTMDIVLGILQRKSLIGMPDPWNHCPPCQSFRVRQSLGTQNSRKRARGGY